jgi:hypothetical protein
MVGLIVALPPPPLTEFVVLDAKLNQYRANGLQLAII